MAKGILRPLDYGGIFDEMFDLYKKHFVLFFGIAAVIHIPIYAITAAIGGPIAAGIGALLNGVMSYVVLAVTTFAVSQCYLNKKTSIADSYKAMGVRTLSLFATMLVAGLLILGGFCLLIVPGVILAFRYAFISEVCILEGKSGKEARIRSAFLAKDNVARIFVVSLLTGILAAVISSVVTAPMQILQAVLVQAHGPSAASGPVGLLVGLVTGIAAAVTTPIQVISFVLLYYDIRIRKEGFDIEMLANNMGVSVPVAIETPVPAAVAAGSGVEERPAMPEVEAGSATSEPEAQAESESPQP
jgi:hypothetical protein